MIYTDVGFVLKKTSLITADSILTLFLKERGKVSVVAKGIKKITSRKSGNLEILSECKFSFAKGRGLDIITEVKPIEQITNLDDPQKLFAFFYISEIIDKMIYDTEENNDIYTLLENVLRDIKNNNISSIKNILTYFSTLMLYFSGEFPDMYICSICKREITEDDKKFYFKSTINHNKCSSNGIPIGNSEIKILKFISKKNLEKYNKLNINSFLEKSLYSLTLQMIEDTINSTIKSKRYIL